MFSGGFKETTQNSAEFPDDGADAFNTLIKWVYTDSLEPYKWVLNAWNDDDESSHLEENRDENDGGDKEGEKNCFLGLGHHQLVSSFRQVMLVRCDRSSCHQFPR